MKTTTPSITTRLTTSSAMAERYPQPSFRPLQDWANMPRRTQTRGLRSDLRTLLHYFSRYGSEAMMALLWASIIPSMTILGTLAGY